MGAMGEVVTADWISGEFFAPASTDLVDGLVGQYKNMRRRAEEVAALVTGETAGAVSYFLEANAGGVSVVILVANRRTVV